VLIDTVDRDHKRRWIVIGIVVAALLALGGYVAWYKFFREEPQPAWVTQDADTRFKYGSIGAENDAGIPYWIFYVLPRMFPEKLPGPGGYASLGVPWEQGQELPVGFTKKVIGFPRVANNCAVCHSTRLRTATNAPPIVIAAGPGPTTNVEGFFRFFVDCAKDPRFTPDNVLWEIMNVTELSWLDKAIYRFLIIPITKKRLLEREQQFAWVYHAAFPEWGRGRDDAMNLTKYFMLKLPMDDSFGPTDMPSIWNLKKYDSPANRMNWAGDSHDAYSVIIDSALGLIGSESGPKDKAGFLAQIDWLKDYLRNKPPPKYPFALDGAKATAGKAIFDQQCATCHASDRTGTPLPLRRRHQSRPHRYVGQGLRGCRQQGRRRHGHRAQGARRGAADRLQRPVPRRHLVARAVPAQRVGADTARPARARRQATKSVLPRVRPLRSSSRRVRIDRRRRGARGHQIRREPAWQRQRRPHVRRHAAGHGQGCARRIPEDALTRCTAAR